jgi:hypothetical protein
MTGVVVIVISVLAEVLVVMDLGISVVGMLMAVFVRVFVRMRMSMLVSVLHISMRVFVQMGMRVIMSVQVLVLVLSFHSQTLLRGVDFFASSSTDSLKPSTRSVNALFFPLRLPATENNRSAKTASVPKSY